MTPYNDQENAACCPATLDYSFDSVKKVVRITGGVGEETTRPSSVGTTWDQIGASGPYPASSEAIVVRMMSPGAWANCCCATRRILRSCPRSAATVSRSGSTACSLTQVRYAM